MIQFHAWTMPAIVFAGFAVLQIVTSNFVYPTICEHFASTRWIATLLSTPK